MVTLHRIALECELIYGRLDSRPGTPFGNFRRAATKRLKANMKRAAPLISAITALLDTLVAVTATPCTVTSPACGRTVFIPPTDFVINLSDPVDPSSVQPSDLTVNGTPADGVIVANNNTTIDFHFSTSPVVQGFNTMRIPAGAFNCGPPVDFTCTFRFNTPRATPTPRPRPTPGLGPRKDLSRLRSNFRCTAV